MKRYALKRDLYLGYAMKICGCKTKAEDLVQEMYLKIHSILNNAPEKELNDSYIYLILRGIFIDETRTSRFKKEVRLNGYDAIDTHHHTAREEVNETLMKMPYFEREILIGAYEEPIQDFAKRLTVSRKTVWVWKKQATEIFEELWQKRQAV